MRRSLLLAIAGLVLTLRPSHGNQLAFFDDFDGAQSAYPGVTAVWSGVTTLEPVQGFAGLGTSSQFGGSFLRNDSAPPTSTKLTLSNLPYHTAVDLSFLLAVIDSWDGVGSTWGFDTFTVTVDGNTVFSDVLDNAGPVVAPGGVPGVQTYVPPPGVEVIRMAELGFRDIDINDQESAYDMAFDPSFNNIPHSNSTMTIEWLAGGPGWQGGIDESFAIDNLSVSLVPEPSASLLAALGFSFAAFGRRALRRAFSRKHTNSVVVA
jgi:hypothetical protein